MSEPTKDNREDVGYDSNLPEHSQPFNDVKNPPLLTKGIASAMCGIFSMPMCMCLGLPSIVLGIVAIILGIWVRRNYRGTTASEAANVASWIGTLTGCVGIVLGTISFIMYLVSGAGISWGILTGR